MRSGSWSIGSAVGGLKRSASPQSDGLPPLDFPPRRAIFLGRVFHVEQSLFDSEAAAELSCIEHRSRCQWGMTFNPKRVPDGWIVEQDCTPEFSAAIYRKYA